MLEKIRIVPFEPQDQNEVRNLIMNGLQEHWGLVDPKKNSDLDNIDASYGGGVFLVAWLGERLVGSGALVPMNAHTAEIKRMSIARDLRRRGVGRLILQQLIERARADSFQQIILETTTTWKDAIAFYLRNGFRITHYQNGDAYFFLDLRR